jgi:hypothetical protein
MENEIENEDSTNLETETETPEKAPEDLAPKLKELEEKNKQLFERAKKAEEKLKEIKPTIQEPKEEPKGTNNNDPKILVRLSKALGEYSEEEIDFIYQVAKDNSPEAIIEASKNEWVQTAINAKREKVEKEKQIPNPSNIPGASTPKGLNIEDMKKDPDLHKKVFEEWVKTGKLQGKEI